MVELVVMRLANMEMVHPAQDNSRVCAVCNEQVGIYPSGQAILRDNPGTRIVCEVCIADQDVDQAFLAPAPARSAPRAGRRGKPEDRAAQGPSYNHTPVTRRGSTRMQPDAELPAAGFHNRQIAKTIGRPRRGSYTGAQAEPDTAQAGRLGRVLRDAGVTGIRARVAPSRSIAAGRRIAIHYHRTQARRRWQGAVAAGMTS